MKVVCMECKEVIKEVKGEGISHSYCQKCGNNVKKRNRVLVERMREIKKHQTYEQLQMTTKVTLCHGTKIS